MRIKDNREMLHELEQCSIDVSSRLDKHIAAGSQSYAKLLEAMRYSLLAGGKRIRPVMCVKFCEAAGGTPEAALDAACAVEMMHTYSLVHDDLPCMDDSDMRRGKPSNHIKFGEYTAVLAGDALQAEAFNTILRSDLPPASVLEITRVLAEASGPHGICGGQYLDLLGVWKPHTKEMLTEIHNMKTAVLMSAGAQIGVIAAGGTPEQVKAAEKYALAVGFAFQVRDDVLDSTAMDRELGKPIGSDLEANKITFAMLLGIDECEEIIRVETAEAIAALEGKFEDVQFLTWLAHYLAERKS